ncbi:MAG: hypothetical protein CVU89_02530 [Firmicutes bacterium HGW-Firmicutes-14]|nr:MAG: hypothetical protein CVU89_02530 [Firmicutes bacterium HGW-Firmicutes-14]
MLDVRSYLEDMRHIIQVKSPAQLRMFVLRYRNENPSLQTLLRFDRAALKQYLFQLEKEVLPLIEWHLNNMSDDPLH